MNTSYPDFTAGKYSLKEIEAWCVKYNVTLLTAYEETSEYPAGTIYKQSQTKGTTVLSGQTLTIYIASEPVVEDDVSDEDLED
jgi:beta-lactam-binding protein with PASTA domain